MHDHYNQASREIVIIVASMVTYIPTYCPDKQKGDLPSNKNNSYWFCGKKENRIFNCKKFQAAKSRNKEANIACEVEDSGNESIDIDELGFGV